MILSDVSRAALRRSLFHRLHQTLAQTSDARGVSGAVSAVDVVVSESEPGLTY